MTISPAPPQNITTLLQKQNRKLKRVLGDGNCFFRALSLFLYDTQENHQKVQDDIVAFIANHQTLFSCLLIDPDGNETMEDHLQKMKKPMVWATQMEIQAAV